MVSLLLSLGVDVGDLLFRSDGGDDGYGALENCNGVMEYDGREGNHDDNSSIVP